MRLQALYFLGAVAVTAGPLSAGAQSLPANDTGHVWAQSPSGGNSMGLPGPNPGGPGLTQYTGGGYPTPAIAMPPAHHAVRPAKARRVHHKAMVQDVALTGDTAARLNREELARIQSGGPPVQPAPVVMSATPMPYPYSYQLSPSGGNSMGIPGPNPGGPGLTPYTY
jgi:hypothetical protein